MKVKEVNLNKLEQLLEETDGELYLVSITFEGLEPVLNLYKPFDDTQKRAEITAQLSKEYQEWSRKMDEYFAEHPEL